MIEILLIAHCVILFLFRRAYIKRAKDQQAMYERQLERWSELFAAQRKQKDGDPDG